MKRTIQNIFTIIVLMQFLSGNLFSQSSVNNFSDSLLTICKKYYNDGFYKKAAELYLDKHPSKLSAEELFYTGLSLSNIRQTVKSAVYLQKASEMLPSNIGYKLQLARVQSQLGRSKESIDTYNSIIARDSSDITALYELGSIYINRKDYTNSIKVFKKIVEQNYYDYLGNYYLAYSIMNQPQNDLTESPEVYLEHSIGNNPEYIPAIELYALFNYNNKNYYAANSLYAIAKKLYPENAEFQFRSGLCFEKLKLFPEAANCFSKAVSIDSSAAGYFDHLGFVYFSIGKFDSCVMAYKKASSLEPNNPTYFLNLGYAYSRLDSADMSIKSFETALKLLPTDKIGNIYNQIAAIHYAKGKFKEAKAAYVQTLLYNPTNIDALFFLAAINDRYKDYKNASLGYRKIMNLAENDSTQMEKLNFANKRIKELKKINPEF